MERALQRNHLLGKLVRAICALEKGRPARVAIDGVDGAGKTTLGDDLAPLIEACGRPVIRASIDCFHRPSEARYRRGSDSPEGFYYDSFDYERLRDLLLDPLGPDGNRRYRTAVFDSRRDSAVRAPELEAPLDAVLLFDGIFAQRPELRGTWDFVIFLHVCFDEALRRSQIRDARPDQPLSELERRFWMRYAAGQRLYLADVRPELAADLVVDHNDPNAPIIVRRSARARSAII